MPLRARADFATLGHHLTLSEVEDNVVYDTDDHLYVHVHFFPHFSLFTV